MTNSSPQNPQPSPPSGISQEELQRIRRQVRRRASEEVMEEWIAVIVAFGTIGAILFWSFGGTKRDSAPPSQSSFLSSSRQNRETEIKADLDLDSQRFPSKENFDDFNITKSSDDAQSEKIPTSDSNYIGSISQDNLNQKSKSLPSWTVPAAIPPVSRIEAPQPAPEAAIPEPPKAAATPEPEAVTTTPEPEPEAVTTTPESEPEAVTATPESESEVVTTEPEVDTPEITFSDLPEQYWAYPFISKLAAEKLIPDTETFDPDTPITRAGMAGLISHAFKDSPAIAATKQFKDVPPDENEVVEDINKAVAIGFMKGYSDENFSPEHDIPRYQVFVALATGLKLEPSNNSDAILQNFSDRQELPNWSLDKVAAATEAGLVINRPGFALTALKPNEPATRAEVAAMIYQTLVKSGKVSPIESQYIVPTP